jgi:hypothetical protein
MAGETRAGVGGRVLEREALDLLLGDAVTARAELAFVLLQQMGAWRAVRVVAAEALALLGGCVGAPTRNRLGHVLVAIGAERGGGLAQHARIV